MFNIEHFILFSLLFALSFLMTQTTQKNYEKNFWGTAALFIISYTLIVGLRYGWGHDYVRYEFSYNMLEYDYSKDYDIAYWGLNKLEKSLGISFAGSVVISTLLIIISYFYIVKAMKGNKYMLMCFLPATLLYTTYAMRQFHAIAYINIAIALILFDDNLLKSKRTNILKSILLIFLAYHTHSGSIAYAIPFVIFLFIKKIGSIPYKITIPAYICTIIFSEIVESFFNETFLSLFQTLTVSNHLQGYIDTADSRLFGASSVDDATFSHGGLYQLIHYTGYICLLYITNRALEIRPNKSVTIIYNIVAVAILLQQIFFAQEIMRRIIDPFVILYFIPLGYAIYIYMLYKKQRFKSYLFYGCCIAVALLPIYYPMYKFLISFNLAGFVWN